MTDYVLSGLTKRRAEMAGETAVLRTRLAAITVDMGHLDAVIRQFDPDHDIAGIRPRRLRGPDAAGRGEMSRFLLGVLREAAEPVTTVEIAKRLAVSRGQDGDDRRLVAGLAKRVRVALARQERQGAVRSVQAAGQLVAWKTAS